ncbi:MAG: hypothetical protein ACYSU0_09890, partial [Planctomycetota bacterium]
MKKVASKKKAGKAEQGATGSGRKQVAEDEATKPAPEPAPEPKEEVAAPPPVEAAAETSPVE